MAVNAVREDRVKELHESALVVDTVNRSVLDAAFFEHVKEGLPDLLGRTILVSSGDVFSPFGFDESLRDIAQLLTTIDANQERLMLVKSASDIHKAKESGRVGIYIYFQSPEPLDKHPWRLRLFYELGLRALQLTYNDRCLVGDGCAEPSDAGLSEYGLRLIQMCNELGIVLDVSHCGDRTTVEAMEASSDPVLITHGMSRSICHNRRCKTDEQVKLCAAKGGVIGVQAMAPFIDDQPEKATIEGVLDHVDHYAELVGTDHIGLGLDLTTGHEHDNFGLLGYKPEMYRGLWRDGVQVSLPGIGSLADLPNITSGLLRRGYTDEDVRKILGGNFVRIFERIWRT